MTTNPQDNKEGCCAKCDNDRQTMRLAIAVPYCINKKCPCHSPDTTQVLTELVRHMTEEKVEMETHECGGPLCPHYPRTEASNTAITRCITLVDEAKDLLTKQERR